ncbi:MULTISPECIES: ArsR/SmtB family transcription factor [Salinibaculum]|uniref:ArsR/SmtB family transcription factor n=1 Tax=Salinibaculum TaxID=2732368 RepID=UPI0030D4157E
MSLRQPTPAGSVERTAPEMTPSSEEILGLLDAEYTQSILEATQTEAKSARALAEECDASRTTVYRRLNSLEDAGLVESSMLYDADGHHRTVFEATLEAVSFSVTANGLSVTITKRGDGQ